MSYDGNFKNPTEGWEVRKDEDEMFRIYVQGRRGWRPHDAKWNKEGFEDEDMAFETIEELREKFEEDYDRYLEENSHAIHQSEMYEMYMREQ